VNNINALPQYYIIEPTNICNFRCPICPNSFFTEEEKGLMDWQLFESILLQIKDVATVIQLYWMGESLLHPRLMDMIRAIKKSSDSKVMLSTNGSLLDANVTNALIDSRIDEIIISLDAAFSHDTYGRIRLGGDFNNVNANVEYLISKNRGIHVVLQFVDMFINRNERESFKKKWAGYDCTVNIQCLYSWANQIPALNLVSDNLSPVAAKYRIPCADLWNKMCVHWNGIVSACCFDWHNMYEYGNANQDSLLNIWCGSKAEALRDVHLRYEYGNVGICKDCDAWAEPNEYESLFHLNQPK